MRRGGNITHRIVGAAVAAALVVAGLVAASLAERNGPLPGPLPLFPADNWWNQDISRRRGPTLRRPTSTSSGRPTACTPTSGAAITGQPTSTGSRRGRGRRPAEEDRAVRLRRRERRLDHTTGRAFRSIRFPTGDHTALLDRRWPPRERDVERRPPHADRGPRPPAPLRALRALLDRHAVEAGSGAFFDLNRTAAGRRAGRRRDAAGLAILPALSATTRCSARTRSATRSASPCGPNGYVLPASHRAGSTAGALPMGARLRLKAATNISGYLPYVQKIFRAMKRMG